jgi:wobble nucleotide-excising tRNase
MDEEWKKDIEELLVYLQLEGRINNLERDQKQLNEELNGLENKITDLKGRILVDDIEEYLKAKNLNAEDD